MSEELFEERTEYTDRVGILWEEDFQRSVIKLVLTYVSINPELDYESVDNYLKEDEAINEYIDKEYQIFERLYSGYFLFWIDAIYNTAATIYDGIRFG